MPVRRYDGRVELRHLRTFLAVADASHFGAAASKLFLSPPAVTEHVQALEREAGVLLFERGRVVRLTDAGIDFVPHARATIAEADAAVAALHEHASGNIGRLRIGVLSNGAGRVTPTIIRGFMMGRPRVKVSLHRLNFHDHLSALIEHAVDVAFVRPAPIDERVEAVQLSEEQRVAVLPAGHSMADAPELKAEDLLDEPFVSVPEDVPPTFVDYLQLRSLRGGLSPRTVDVGCGDVTDVLAAVSAGRGVASAVESFRGYENWPGISYVPLVGADPGRNTLLSRRNDPSPIVSDFIASAMAMMAQYTDELQGSGRA